MSQYQNYAPKMTNYKGKWFRSNLEAKTAEALDRLGIEWEYERRCWRDPRFHHGQYTPDFYLPALDLYVEVAGVIDERHFHNVATLSDLIGCAKVLAVDGNGNTTIYDYDDPTRGGTCGLQEWFSWGQPGVNFYPNLFEYAGMHHA